MELNELIHLIEIADMPQSVAPGKISFSGMQLYVQWNLGYPALMGARHVRYVKSMAYSA